MDFGERLHGFAIELSALNLKGHDAEYRDAFIGHIEGMIACCGHESCMKKSFIETMAAFAIDTITNNVNELIKNAALNFLNQEMETIRVNQ